MRTCRIAFGSYFPNHDVRTVDFQGWKSLGNGELLKVAEEAGFDVLITADRSMPYQQKLEHRKIAILILSSNERELIAAHLGQIDAAIGTAPSGIFLTVDLGS